MTAARSTKEEHRYKKARRQSPDMGCPFCAIKPGYNEFIEELETLKIITNKYPYTMWDGQGVVDHLMIVPKAHTDSLGTLDAQAAVEYIKLVEKYEALGYNLYARAPASTVKTIVHQHTHLIKLDGKPRHLIFSMNRPFYFRISR